MPRYLKASGLMGEPTTPRIGRAGAELAGGGAEIGDDLGDVCLLPRNVEAGLTRRRDTA